MKRFLFLIAAAVFTCSHFSYAADLENREFIFGMHFSSQSGYSSSTEFDYANRILSTLMEVTPFTIKLDKAPSEADIIKGFIDKKYDMARLYPYQVVQIIEGGGNVYPLITYALDKSRKMQYCFYQSKENSFGTLEDVFGKRLIRQHYNPFAYLQIREHLFQNGIDKPLWDVFESFTSVPSNNSALMAVAAGKADLYWTSGEIGIILKYLNPAIQQKVHSGLCTDKTYGHMFLGFNKETITKEEFGEIREVIKVFLANIDEIANKDNDFKAGLSYLRLEKGKFVLADPKMYESEIALYEKSKSNGWLDEAKFISENLKEVRMGTPVVVEPDLPYCKKKCGEDNECVVQCLSR